jgi:hypothetical protein
MGQTTSQATITLRSRLAHMALLDGCCVKQNYVSQNRPFPETYGSAFLKARRITSTSTKLLLAKSQNLSHNENLKVRHEVACVEWSKSSQSRIQDCPQSLSASRVTVE